MSLLLLVPAVIGFGVIRSNAIRRNALLRCSRENGFATVSPQRIEVSA